MDTIEEINDTYFYRGHPNLSKIELLNVIFLEEFCLELGLDSISAAAILSGQPWLGTRAKPKGAQVGTSIVSKYSRILLRDARLPFGIQIPTPVGVRMQKSNKIAAVIARWVPWIGWASLVMSLHHISTRVQNKYNLIARPKDRIQWAAL
ncbi:STM2901 family protein [Pseudenterobacter timonensis]|uniref:STM2901 family protein n=1 Tax=Pseudenterobacter timonensis TaxID=1755099 RepID=A0ABV4A7V3_9ENTR